MFVIEVRAHATRLEPDRPIERDKPELIAFVNKNDA